MDNKSLQSLLISTIVSLTTVFMIGACKKSTSDSTTTSTEEADSTSELAKASASDVSSAASSSGGSASSSTNPMNVIFTEQELSQDYVDPQSVFKPTSACTYSDARGTCSAGVLTSTWGGCTVSSATLTGSWTETYTTSGTGTCPTTYLTFLLTSGNSLNRKTVSGSPEVVTFASGATLTSDTDGGTAYTGSATSTTGVVIPSTGITVTGGTTRTIVNSGIHRVLKGSKGTTLFDHFNTYNISVTGTSRATRNVSGTATTYHNLAKYTANHSFNGTTPSGASVASAALTYSTGCCYPTGGKIVTTFGTDNSTYAGKSNVLDFSPGATTCGQATFTSEDGSTSTVTLTNCR